MSGWGNIGRPLIVIITLALISMTVVSSLLVYTAQQTMESRIDLVTRQMLRDDLVREARQTSSEVTIGLRNIEQTLSALALAVSGLDPASDSALQTLLLTKSALAQYTDNIVWLSADGALAYTTREDMSDLVGSDLSDRRFYDIPLATNRPVVTSSILRVDSTPSIAVAAPVPISSTNDTFSGSLAALVPLDTIPSAFLESQAFAEKPTMVVASDGTILVHPFESLVGARATDPETLRLASEDTRGVVERNFGMMLQGRSGAMEYNSPDGGETLMAYEPVVINGAHTWTVAVFQPTSTVREPFSAVFGERQSFTLIATGLIAAVSAVFIVFILLLNKRLFATVSEQDKKIVGQLSELQTAYERLKEQDVIKDEFINIAAHELRTPVLPIILSAENLADSIPEDENVKIILRNANRITKLTNDILDVSRIESNTFKLQRQKVNIRRLAEDVIQDAKLRIPAGQNVNLVLESSVIPSSEELFIDRSRINQVLVNLVDNAINFTEEGTIRVMLEPGEDNLVKVSVIDPGKGIDPAVRERLFGKFVSKSNRSTGTGLGLYLSKAIVEAHGGTISGENNADGKGAAFSFTLPIE